MYMWHLTKDKLTYLLTYADLSLVRVNDIHLKAISQKAAQPLITKITLKITYKNVTKISQGPMS